MGNWKRQGYLGDRDGIGTGNDGNSNSQCVCPVYIRFLRREYDHGPSIKVKVKCPSIVVSIVHILIAIGRPAPPKVRGLWVR